MPSSFPSSGVKQHLTKKQNSFVAVLIGFSYFFSFILLFFGLRERHQSNTFVAHQCQIKSIDVIRKTRTYYSRWYITVVDENPIKDDVLTSSSGVRPESWAWSRARKYKINQTYPCYRSKNETSIHQWDWQWNKPAKLKAYSCLFGSTMLVIIATILFILRRYYQAELKNTQEQAQQQQTIESPESPPPAYDKVVEQS